MKIRDALWRLTEPPASPRATVGIPMPLFARAPYIAVLWAATIIALVTLLALGRVRIPRVARGVVVAVPADTGGVTLLFLLPASSRPFVAAGQHAEVETEDGQRVVLTARDVEPNLLDADAARWRFAQHPGVLARLEGPKVAIHLGPCGAGRCLTPNPGHTYQATATIGTRSLASYALPGS